MGSVLDFIKQEKDRLAGGAPVETAPATPSDGAAPPASPRMGGVLGFIEREKARLAVPPPVMPDTDPDKAAESRRLGQKHGVPAAVVMGAPDQFRAMDEQVETNNALRDRPALLGWLQDPDNAAVAKDDLPVLSEIESLGMLPGLMRSPRPPSPAADPVASDRERTPRPPSLFSTPSRVPVKGPEYYAEIDRRLAEEARKAARPKPEMSRVESATGAVAQGAAAIAGGVVKSFAFLHGKTDLTERFNSEVQRAIEENARIEAMLEAGENTDGSPLADTDSARLLQIYEGNAKAVETALPLIAAEVDALPLNERGWFRDGQALIDAVAEAMPTDPGFEGDFVTDKLASGLGSVVGFAGSALLGGIVGGTTVAAANGAVGQYEDAVANGADEETAMKAAGFGTFIGALEMVPLMRQLSPAGKRAIVAGLMRIGQSGTEEAAQEALSTSLENLTAQGLYDPERGVLEGTGEAALIGLILGSAVRTGTEAVVSGSALVGRAKAALQAGRTGTTLEKVDDAAARSRLRQRAPDAFRSFLESTGHADIMINVPADELQTFFQAKDIPFSEFEIDRDVFDEALTAGGTVGIPASVYAEKFAGTENGQFFHDNGTIDDGEMSRSEAARFNEAWQDELAAAWEAAMADERAELESRAGDIQVRDAIFSRLREAGRSPDVAERESAVWAAFFRTMGERYGDDALDLFREFGVRIEGPRQMSEQRRFRSEIDAALNTLRSSGRPKEKKPPLSLVEWVIKQGGIAVDPGEFPDAPAGVVAEKDDGADMLGAPGKGKNAPDHLGLRAVEDGFFPEHRGKVSMGTDGPATDFAAVLMDGISRELGGEKVLIPEDEFAYQTMDDRLRDLADELDAAGVDLARMTNDEIVAAMSAGETFQQEKRGSITFPADGATNGETVIRLFESADLSTFLHESGHFFLEAFRTIAERPDAPASMKEDIDAINRFVGHKGGAYGVDAQEKWARGFEAYLLEGNSPSLELMDAFSRFKAWLTRIYKSVAGLGVKLTPQIRDVMDRMLATDAEIQAAREQQNMGPLFANPQEAGMSPAEFEPYARIARRATAQAEQSLLAKTMAKIKRERMKWYREERKAVLAEVTEATNRRREYRLIDLMANGTWIGGEIDEVPDMRLDRAELVERFSKGVLQEISVKRFGGDRAIYADGGVPLDVAADFFGFRSGDEMVRVLQNTMRKKQFVKSEVERIMTERHGDPLNDGSIEEEALAAIHSEQQAKTVAAEARQLAKRAGKDHRNITSRIFRQRARAMLGRMSVKDAARPGQFLAAERKAAREAQRAFASVTASTMGGRADPKAAFESAFRFKQQEMLNHHLYMEARNLEAYVKRAREKMRSYAKKSVREKLAGDYIEQIDGLLDAYDFRARSAGSVQRDANLAAYVDKMIAEGRESQLDIDPRLIENARRVHYSRLSVDELRGLVDTIANIDHMGRFKNKLIDAKRARDMDIVAGDITEEFRKNVKPRPPSRVETSGERMRKIGRDYLNLTLNADTLLREIDGFADLGPTWSHIKLPIDEAQNRIVERHKKMAEDMDALYSVYSLKEQREMNARKAIPGMDWSLSKWSVIAIALNTGNETNYDRLLSGGKNAMTPEQVDAAMATLTEKDWRFVQSMWDYIGSFWPEIEAKERRMTGTGPKRVDAKPMIPAHPFVRGGYYPIKYDNRLSGLAEDFTTKDIADSMKGGRFGKAQTRNGHTKARAETVDMPVLLDISVAHQHVQQVIHDLEMGEPVNNAWRILQDARVREAFRSAGKASDWEALDIWVHDVASGEQVAARGLEKWLRHVRSGFTISRLALNISTALIQPSGILQTAVLLGKRDTVRGMVSYMSNRSRWVSEVLAVSSLMRERQTTFQRDMHNIVGDMEGRQITGRYEKFQRDAIIPASFYLMQKVQFYSVDMPTWVAAYEKEIRKSGDEARARTYADSMVKRLQGSGLMSDRGMLERGTTARESRQREFPRALTALGSYMFAKFNVAYERAAKTDLRSPVQIMHLALDFALLFTMEAVLYSLVKGGLPDEDEDEGWTGWLASQTALTAMSTLPYLREVSGALQGFGGGGVFGSGVEIMARPFLQAQQGDFDKALVKSLVNASGVLLHLPASQINVAIDALFDQEMNARPDPSIFEFLVKRHD